jgi:CRISPR-associated protein Cas1
MVRKRDQQLLVTKDGKTVEEVPLNKLDQVVLMGRGVQMSTALLIELLDKGIPVTLTNQKGSRHYVTLMPPASQRFAALRTAQMYFVNDPPRALALAQAKISAKLANQRGVLAATGWAAAATATQLIDAQRANLATASTLDMVRGYEGAAAAAYFGAWRATLPSAWGFQGRAFYPPPDPINAMLSFGYTLALNDVLNAVQITGLDPYLGTFHVAEAGRPSLALDLLEEFRPLLVDRLVLELLRTQAIGPGQFERPPQNQAAVYLNEEGRTLLVNRYEALLHSNVALPNGQQTIWRRVLLLQAQAVARVIRGEQPGYVGFTL